MTDAPRTWEQGLDAVLAHMRAIMVERHRKYGPENIRQYGVFGCLVRASDKLTRLSHDATDFPDESVDDTHTDLGNYGSVIPLMLRWGYWDLPAECLGGR